MKYQIIPANPGFFATWLDAEDELQREAVVAWVINLEDIWDAPTPLGVEGIFPPNAAVTHNGG